MRPRIVSAQPVDAWVEQEGLGFVAFSLRPMARDPQAVWAFQGIVATFVVDVQTASILAARTTHIGASGQVSEGEELQAAHPALFERALRSGGVCDHAEGGRPSGSH